MSADWTLGEGSCLQTVVFSMWPSATFRREPFVVLVLYKDANPDIEAYPSDLI